MFTGTIGFDAEVDPAALPIHLADCLRRVDARAVQIEGERVTFTGGVFRSVNNWNVLVPFAFGELTVDPNNRQVRCRRSFRQLMIGGTVAAGFMAILILFAPGVRQVLLFIPFVWAWLVGGNLAIGIPRFQSFVSRAIAAAPRRS